MNEGFTMSNIYMDNSATTALSEAAKAKINQTLDVFGNPSSLHKMGQEAQAVVEQARASILSALGVRARMGSFVFTSCGTEATSLALLGSAYAKQRRDATRILTTDSEHPSVSRALDKLALDGFEIVKIPTRSGVLDMSALEAALDKKIFLATFMLVNNETGARYDVESAFSLIKRKYPDAITHCDAVQAFMKIPFTAASLRADLITVSGHKLHAPKGVGGLYISADMIKAKKIVPFLVGGGQESGFRSGTENVLGIAAFGASVADIASRRKEISEKMLALRQYAEKALESLDVRINRPAGEYLPNIINITLPSIKSETMLHHLSADGIFVSSGSACSSHSAHPRDSLIAFGITPKEADCSLRISLSEYNTEADIDALTASLARGIERLVKIK